MPEQNTFLSISPSSSTFIQQQNLNDFQQKLNAITQNSIPNLFSNSNEPNISNSDLNSFLASLNNTNIMERLAAFFFIQQEQQRSQQQNLLLDEFSTSSSIYTSQIQPVCSSMPSLIEMQSNNDVKNIPNKNLIINNKLNNNNLKTLNNNIIDLKSLNLFNNSTTKHKNLSM